MTPFAIFAFVLTFGYVIYFAVMITLDLHVKPVDGQKAEGEDIDVEGMTDEGDETPKVITEDPDSEGARMTYTDSVDEDGVRVVNPTGTVAIPSEDEEPAEDEEEAAERLVKRKEKQAEKNKNKSNEVVETAEQLAEGERQRKELERNARNK